MTSGGGTFSPEEIKYLKSLSAVAEATAKRITYTDDFKRYCVVHYNEGASPVRMFREAGLDPALIGYKRIERCLARWRESQDEILNSGNAKAGVADSSGGCNTWGLSGLPWSRCRLLRLSRGVEQFDDLLAWFHEPEGFAWPVVEFLGDRVEVVLRVDG